jgi:hypothetical protein
VIYKEARHAGVRRSDLKAAVQNYHTAVAGGIPEGKPEATGNDTNNDHDITEHHFSIIDAALARVRGGAGLNQ